MVNFQIKYDLDQKTMLVKYDNAIDVKSIKYLLHKNKLLDKPIMDKNSRYWPGDKEEKN